MSIHFYSQNISFSPPNKRKLKTWISDAITKEKKQEGNINFIFCNDEYLLQHNQTYLKHTTYTDIITFDYSEKGCISGDVFISVERIKENAKKFDVAFLNELHRVMIHGILHLMGYTDKSKSTKLLMTKKENFYLRFLE